MIYNVLECVASAGMRSEMDAKIVAVHVEKEIQRDESSWLISLHCRAMDAMDD